jgi:hypothetical protein
MARKPNQRDSSHTHTFATAIGASETLRQRLWIGKSKAPVQKIIKSNFKNEP